MCGEEAAIDVAALVLKHAYGHLNSGIAKHGNATAAHLWERVAHAYYHSAKSALNEQFGARWRLAIVRTRFESHIDCSAAQQRAVGHRSHSVHFGMTLAVAAVKALADNLAISHNHRPHHRVGRHIARAECRELQRAPHISFIVGNIHIKNICFRALCRGVRLRVPVSDGKVTINEWKNKQFF